MDITLSSESQRVIEEQVRSGQYQRADQVVEEAIQLLAFHRQVEEAPAYIERLRALVKVGIDQADRGECGPLDFGKLRARLHREYEERRRAGGGRGNRNGVR